MIGLCTAVIGDVAGHLGCFIFLKDSVNAIAFVALGTSVPGRIGKKIKGPSIQHYVFDFSKTIGRVIFGFFMIFFIILWGKF